MQAPAPVRATIVSVPVWAHERWQLRWLRLVASVLSSVGLVTTNSSMAGHPKSWFLTPGLGMGQVTQTIAAPGCMATLDPGPKTG